jgi:hypothetical protein
MTVVLASVLTGLFALAGSLATLFLRGRQERTAAQNERLWSRRAETYVDLLQYHGSGMIEGYRETATAIEWTIRDVLTAKATAFASDEVRELWQQSAKASFEWEAYIDDEWPQLSVAVVDSAEREEAEKDPEFRRFRQASEEAEKQLAVQIRIELDISRPEGARVSLWHARRGPGHRAADNAAAIANAWARAAGTEAAAREAIEQARADAEQAGQRAAAAEAHAEAAWAEAARAREDAGRELDNLRADAERERAVFESRAQVLEEARTDLRAALEARASGKE